MINPQTQRSAIGLAMLASIAALIGFTPARAEKFNGVYVGADAGREAGRGPDGWTFGGFAGFNVKIGDRIVAGAEARLADSTIGDVTRSETATQVTVVDNRVGRSIGVMARAGWLAGENSLIFVRAGWEDTRFKGVRTRTPKPPTTNPNPVTDDFSFNADSLILGGGVEHFVSDQISVRLVYDWAEDFNRHQLKAGIAFNF